jgi:hypothetical protein
MGVVRASTYACRVLCMGICNCVRVWVPTAMFRSYLVYIMLLKLAFYFFEVFAIQFLVLVLQTADPEYALTITIIVLALPIVIYGIYCVRAHTQTHA